MWLLSPDNVTFGATCWLTHLHYTVTLSSSIIISVGPLSVLRVVASLTLWTAEQFSSRSSSFLQSVLVEGWNKRLQEDKSTFTSCRYTTGTPTIRGSSFPSAAEVFPLSSVYSCPDEYDQPPQWLLLITVHGVIHSYTEPFPPRFFHRTVATAAEKVSLTRINKPGTRGWISRNQGLQVPRITHTA